MRCLLLIMMFFCFCAAETRAQTIEMKSRVSLMDTIIIDVQNNLEINFFSAFSGAQEVKVSDVYDENNKQKRAGLIKISGASVETMINLESEVVSEKALVGGNSSVRVSNFDLVSEGAGTSVTVLPNGDDDSYLMPVGGVVNVTNDLEFSFTGVNIVNVNYL